MIRFVLHPGFVVSVNDGDLHKISASQLADLYGVSLNECIVVDPERPETTQGYGDLSQYLHLFPSAQGAAYWRISDVERAQYPLGVTPYSWSVRSGERRVYALRSCTLSDLYRVVREALS